MTMKKSGELIERLKCCWYILTMRNFYVSCYANDMIQVNAEGWIEHPKPGSIKGYHKEYTVSDLEEAATSFARKDSEGISNPANFYYTVADKARIFKAGAQWKEEQIMAKVVDVTISIPYPNGDGEYSQIVDSKVALPFGDNIKVLVIKEE